MTKFNENNMETSKISTIWSIPHYADMSMQYTAIFHGSKNDNFQMKIFDIFLIFAQNIDCGYTLEHGHVILMFLQFGQSQYV